MLKQCLKYLSVYLLINTHSFAEGQASASTPSQQYAVGILAAPNMMSGVSPASGLELQYRFNPNLHLHFFHASGTTDLTNVADNNNYAVAKKLELAGQLNVLRLKKYFGGSFYVAGGLGHRHIAFDIRVVSTINSSIFVETQGSVNSFVADLGLGNTWHWDSGFYLGCEWIGADIPLQSSSSVTTSGSGGTSEEIEQLNDDLQKGAADIGEITSLNLLVLHLGWSF